MSPSKKGPTNYSSSGEFTTNIPSRPRKSRRKWKSGEKAHKECRYWQKKVKLLIPKAAFDRLVKEILNEHITVGGSFNGRMTNEAKEALQEAAENFLIETFDQGGSCMLHRRAFTLKTEDLDLALSFRNYYFGDQSYTGDKRAEALGKSSGTK